MDRKRKFNSYQEPTSASMEPQGSNRSNRKSAPPRSIRPTPETQELYNLWRQAQDRQEEDQLLTQESLQQVQDGTNDYLQLPSRSQATTSSPSHASTTNSIAGPLRDMDLNAARPSTNRPGRHGPLSEVKKRKAALMRKVKACEECRARRVECTHWEVSLFEAEYQRTRRVQRPPAPAVNPSDLTRESTGPYQPSFSEPNDLFGVGGGLDSAFQPAIGSLAGRHNRQMDFDPLWEQAQHQHSSIQPHVLSALNSVSYRLAAPNPRSQHGFNAPPYSLPVPQYPGAFPTTPGIVTGQMHTPAPTSQPMLTSRSRGYPGTPQRVQISPTRRTGTATSAQRPPQFGRYSATAQALPTSAFQDAAATFQATPMAPYQAPAVMSQNSPADPSVLIGRQEIIPYGIWVCAGSVGATSSSLSPGGSVPCNEVFQTLDQLKQHYSSFHSPFYNDASIWGCSGCTQVSNDELISTRPCPQCPAFSWQRWHWANVGFPAISASRPLVRVTSRDGSFASHSSQTGYSTQLSSPGGGRYNSPYTSYPPSGGYGYPNSSGQYSNKAQAMIAQDCSSADAEKAKAGTSEDDDDAPPPYAPTPAPAGYESKTLGATTTDMWDPATYRQLCPLNGSTDGERMSALLFRHRHACPAAAVLLVVVIAVVDAWLSTGGGGLLMQMCSGVVPFREGGGGVGVGVGGGGCVGMQELSVVCIGAGLVATWLFRHVKVRMRRQRERKGEGMGVGAEGGRGVEGEGWWGGEGQDEGVPEVAVG